MPGFLCTLQQFRGLSFLCGGSSVVERRTRDWKVEGSIPDKSDGRIFFSRVNFLCCISYRSIRFAPVLPQWHVKDPDHSAKSAGGRLHLNTHTPVTQRNRSGLALSLSRHSVGTYPEMSSHATCQAREHSVIIVSAR